MTQSRTPDGIAVPIPPSTLPRNVFRYVLNAVILGCLLAGAAICPAQAPANMPEPWAAESTPYVADPGYNNGLIAPDAFAGSFSRDYRGSKLVRLTNGDIVVAGIVPPWGSGTNVVNLGLVRYNSSGARLAWSNPTTAYAFFGNNYLIYPNANDNPDGQILAVKDIKLYGDRIFVLVDGRNYSEPGGTHAASRVLVFRTDGQFLANNVVSEHFLGSVAGGIALYDNGLFPATVSLVFVGSTGYTSRPQFRRFTVNADSSLTAETGIVSPNPGNYCPTDRGCELHAIGMGGRTTTTSPPRLYLAGTRYQSGSNDWDFLVMSVDSNGVPRTSFSADGVTTVAMNVGGDGYDRANAIVVEPGFLSSNDRVYLVGDVAQDCKDGIGIAKLNEDGSNDHDFGQFNIITLQRTGKQVVGGSNRSPCVLTGTGEAHGEAATIDGGRLAIAGSYVYLPAFLCIPGSPCAEDNVDGLVSILDTASGDVLSYSSYAYRDGVGGVRTRHSGFHGIARGGNDTFTVAGEARYFQSAAGAPSGANQYATFRVRSDVLFRHGFDSN